MKTTLVFIVLLAIAFTADRDYALLPQSQASYQSCPPLRPLPQPSTRPIGLGPARFVDAEHGDDANDGSKTAPWRTINHALGQLNAGETLYLRGGVYHENVYCGVAGHADARITIRSYPEEQAIIDGGMREFLESPATAWEACPGGAPDEYRSTKTYKNIRDVLGSFADSGVGLQTYWHSMDLRATNELAIPDPDKKIMVLPIYCGPGLWYDRETGYIHIRLAHTHLNVPGVPNYKGETDPRKLPLVISRFSSTPLLVDMADYVQFQDLIIRGGGYISVQLQFGMHLDFDNVIVYGGSYGMRARSTGPLKMTNCALYGSLPPWGSYFANGLYTYDPRFLDPFLTGPETANMRNIAHLTGHYCLVTEGMDESSVFAYPFNHDWDISYSEFADAFDGVQCTGPNMRFHHNWISVRSNAIELSALTPTPHDNDYYYENLITRSTIAFSCHPLSGAATGHRYVFRNIVDNRRGAFFDSPSPEHPKGSTKASIAFLVHGNGGEIQSISFYQNTIINPQMPRAFAQDFLYRTSPGSTRQVLNNMFVYLGKYPETYVEPSDSISNDVECDGNLHWCPTPGERAPANYLDPIRQSKMSIANQKKHTLPWEARSIVADPKFVAFSENPEAQNDYRLRKESPAVGKGIELPPTLEDPLRPKAGAPPDIGALPLDSEPLHVGIHGRIVAGVGDPEKQ